MVLKNYNVLMSYVQRHFRSMLPFLTVSKATNIIKALYELYTKRIVCSSRPLVYRIDPCSLCNLKCVSCKTPYAETREKRVMDVKDYVTIVGKIRKHAMRVSLYDMGEPLLHKEIYTMIKHTTENRISSLISTNFTLFNETDTKELIESGLTVLEPCLDGFTQKTYERYRRGGDVETIKRGIRSVMQYKKLGGYRWPTMDVQVVLFKHVLDEISLIRAFLQENDVDKITYRREILGFDGQNKKAAMQYSVRNKSCFWLYLGMMIRPDGNVYPCCGRDFDRFPYGNILENSLDEIWNNEFYRISRQMFLKGPALELSGEFLKIPCLTCEQFKIVRSIVSITDEDEEGCRVY